MNTDTVLFVFRNLETLEIHCEHLEKARELEKQPLFQHLATLEPRLWIKEHYEKVEDL